MASLQYNEGHIEAALARFSPPRQLLFAWRLCHRLVDLVALSQSDQSCQTALSLVWNLYFQAAVPANHKQIEALSQAALEIESQLRNSQAVRDVLANLAQESREAILILLESCRHPEHRLADCLSIARISRECVENLAEANLQAVQWDPDLAEKVRLHPLVQQELQDLYGDLVSIWEHPDNPSGYQALYPAQA